MNEAVRTVQVSPGSEVARAISEAERGGGLLDVDTGERVYRVRVSARAPSEPRSRRHRRKLLSFAGVWKDLHGDELLEKLDRARHESPPSPPARG